MKHSSRASRLDPIQIGESVRTMVGAFLHSTPADLDRDFLDRIEKLGGTLALWGSRMNLTAHPDDPEEIAFHVIDSVMPLILASDPASPLHDQFSTGREILDLGSGAGFPGLVLAAASSADFTLVESRRKRASFLQVALVDMGLENARIEVARAEEVTVGRQYDLVTARAFGEPSEFFTLAGKALKAGGLAMLFANPTQVFAADVDRRPYSLRRKGILVPRILAICRKLVDSRREPI